MLLSQLREEFKRAAELETATALCYAFACRGEEWPVNERRTIMITPQLVNALTFKLQSALFDVRIETGIELPEALTGRNLAEELYDLARDCLRQNERIEPRFLVKAP